MIDWEEEIKQRGEMDNSSLTQLVHTKRKRKQFADTFFPSLPFPALIVPFVFVFIAFRSVSVCLFLFFLSLFSRFSSLSGPSLMARFGSFAYVAYDSMCMSPPFFSSSSWCSRLFFFFVSFESFDFFFYVSFITSTAGEPRTRWDGTGTGNPWT